MIDLTSTPPEYQPEQACQEYPGCNKTSQQYPLQPGCRDIAVIVTAHNGAAFLDECMESILAQELQPEQIVIVDDCSTHDNTLAVARSYERHGCKIVQTPKNLGMCGARMHGLQGVHSPVVMFFDGDDVMPPGYLATMRSELSSHGFVYPGRSMFGSRHEHIPALDPDRASLWRQNFCPSPSLMWRHVFDQAGGWQPPTPEGTLPDWSLFLRMSGISTFRASRASCMVRKHAGNFSGQRFPRPISQIRGDARMHAATLTIGTVYSGRVPEFRGQWLAHVAGSLRRAGKQAHLLILDDSTTGFVGQPVLHHPEFTGFTIKRVGSSTFEHRRKNPPLISQFLASACNQMLREATGDLLWIIEDDIAVPVNACQDLMRQILASTGAPIPAACGCYRSRHEPSRFILSSVGHHGILHHKSPPPEPSPIQLTGTGCLMILRDLVQGMAFRPQWSHGSTRSNAHDWTFSHDLFHQGRPVIAVPSVVCPHYSSSAEFV